MMVDDGIWLLLCRRWPQLIMKGRDTRADQAPVGKGHNKAEEQTNTVRWFLWKMVIVHRNLFLKGQLRPGGIQRHTAENVASLVTSQSQRIVLKRSQNSSAQTDSCSSVYDVGVNTEVNIFYK